MVRSKLAVRGFVVLHIMIICFLSIAIVLYIRIIIYWDHSVWRYYEIIWRVNSHTFEFWWSWRDSKMGAPPILMSFSVKGLIWLILNCSPISKIRQMPSRQLKSKLLWDVVILDTKCSITFELKRNLETNFAYPFKTILEMRNTTSFLILSLPSFRKLKSLSVSVYLLRNSLM